MIRRSSQILVVWFLLWDLALTAASWLAAYVVRFETGWIPLHHEPIDFELCLGRLPLILILAAAAFRFAGLYQVHRLRRFREELVGVFKGASLLLLLVLATVFYRQEYYESRLTMLIFYGFTLCLVLAARRVSWQTIRRLRRLGYNQTPALIVGTGRVARKAARALRHASWTGMYALGFIEDQPNRWTSDLKILGTVDDLPRLIEEHQIGHVFIALPFSRYHEARRVFDKLSQTLVEVRLVADVSTMAGLSFTTTTLDGLPVIGLRESPHFGMNVVVKRTMDVALSSLALIVLSPLMLLIALLIKLTSRGPVFYRQERCGLNGDRFQMLKFRSMRTDAEAQSGPVWAQKEDPRRTRLGTFLRTTSLDELPQLINVLKGDMSLVGPRPERPVFIQQFRRTVPNYMVRHCVKAGITGWAQVNGWRGNTSLRKRLEHDLYYITHWNPWLDIRILWLTVFRGLVNRNAY
jgi:Undecaprenyl-phosphate glucose phosphotransferase